MKPIKLGTLAVAAVVALGAYSTKAAVGVTTNYSKLNISATITTNTAEVVSGTNWKYPTKTTKFGNKQLLDLFAHWDGADRTVEPWKSAKLEVGWDWGYDVLVVDKTGTNVLFDANYWPEQYFTVDFFDEYGVGASSGKAADPGYYAVTDTGTAYFELYDDDYYLPYTYLSAYGGNKQTFKQNWDATDTDTTWSDSESAKFLYNGDEYWLGWDGDNSDVTVTATISASGKGKGGNYIGWAD